VFDPSGISPTLSSQEVQGRYNILQINPGAAQDHRIYEDEGISPTISPGAQAGGAAIPKILTHYGHRDKSPDVMDQAPTLKAQSHGHEPMVYHQNMGGNVTARDTSDAISSGSRRNYQLFDLIRRRTPTECERLQGFPDGWTAQGSNGSMSDTRRYKALGNAVTVNVVEAIAESLTDSISQPPQLLP